MAKSHLQRFFFQEAEFFRRVKSRDRQVVFGWSQILADGQDINLASRQIVKHFQQLVRALANPAQ